MNDVAKAKQLRKHKLLATGLFVLMLAVYVLMIWLSRHHQWSWIGYISSFSEAAMVGALADWFAVTALFHHPLGIPIPHTNLIERSKKSIGDNLGAFVVGNFLTAGNIRPYIDKLKVSAYAAQWLEKEKNKKLLVTEIARLLDDIIQKMDDDTITKFMSRKAADLLADIKLNVMVGNALRYFLDKGEHEKLITLMAGKIKVYISEHEEIVREKVKSESYFFIPKFVDNKLAAKITSGLVNYFEEIELDTNHRLRDEISTQLYAFVDAMRTEGKWEKEFVGLAANLLSADKLQEYAAAAWNSIKATLQKELNGDDGVVKQYFSKTIEELAYNLKHDEAMQQKIDGWIRQTAYQYILKNTEQVGTLISNTVGAWEGRELSRKLELEVGKDLQFIRINGTIVGGMVGLLIYALTEWLS